MNVEIVKDCKADPGALIQITCAICPSVSIYLDFTIDFNMRLTIGP